MLLVRQWLGLAAPPSVEPRSIDDVCSLPENHRTRRSTPRARLALPVVVALSTFGVSLAAQTGPEGAKTPTTQAAPNGAAESPTPSIIPPGPRIDLSTLRFQPESFAADAPSGDDELFQWIEAKQGEMPDDTRDVPTAGDELVRVQILVDTMIEAGWKHVNTYPESEHRDDVLQLLARLHTLNQARFMAAEMEAYKQALQQNMPAPELAELQFRYLRSILEIVQAGLAADPDPVTRSRLMASLGDVYKMASGPFNQLHRYDDFARTNREAARAFDEARRALSPHPDDIDLRIRRLDALLTGREFDQVATECEQFVETYPRSRYTPHIFFWWHQAYRRSGQLEKGLALWERWAPALDAGAKGEPMPEWLDGGGWVADDKAKEGYQVYRDRVLFYRGFFNYALQEFHRARTLLGDFLVAMNELEGAGTLGMASKVYRDAMAYYLNKNLYALFEEVENSEAPKLVGKPAPELAIGDGWVTPFPKEADEGATCYLLLFCGESSARGRQYELFSALDELLKSRREDGLRVCWISSGSRLRDTNVAEEKSKIASFLKERNLDWPAGIDLDPTIPVWSSFAINRGSVHLFLADGETRMRWQLVDPMAWDIGLIESVVDRVIASKVSKKTPR